MPTKTPSRLKKDAYRAARGGRSQLFDLSCERCGSHVALYQKDGPGPLKRIYLDRIHAPAALSAGTSVRKMSDLVCTKCGEQLGIPMIYEKEGRIAYKLFQSVIAKKKHVSRAKKA